jgi:hypothetical protein
MMAILRRMLWIIAVVVLAALGTWRLTLVAGQPPQKRADVHLVSPGQPIGGNAGQKGATYYGLESQTSRFTTLFLDGTKAVAERGADGDVLTRLEDASGNEINRIRVDRNDGAHDVVQYLRPTGEVVQALVESQAKPTLDWSNRQSHRLYQDRVTAGAGLQWNDGLIRRAGATEKDEEQSLVRSVETQWAKGISAKTTRVGSKRGQVFDGHAVRGDVLVTKLMRDGVEIGIANYFTHERIYAWSIPGVTDGSIANEHLKQRHGGWPFTPDMVWMNLQTIGLYHWKTIINEKGFVARRQGRAAPCQQTVSSRKSILEYFAPTVLANEAGCDPPLHWLDGTVLRFCCDIHDYCYEKNGCTWSTWWQWWSSWQCDRCNGNVVWCFMGGGSGHGPFSPFPW